MSEIVNEIMETTQKIMEIGIDKPSFGLAFIRDMATTVSCMVERGLLDADIPSDKSKKLWYDVKSEKFMYKNAPVPRTIENVKTINDLSEIFDIFKIFPEYVKEILLAMEEKASKNESLELLYKSEMNGIKRTVDSWLYHMQILIDVKAAVLFAGQR